MQYLPHNESNNENNKNYNNYTLLKIDIASYTTQVTSIQLSALKFVWTKITITDLSLKMMQEERFD